MIRKILFVALFLASGAAFAVNPSPETGTEKLDAPPVEAGTVKLSDFCTLDPSGATDTAPCFDAAIASVPAGRYIKIIVPNLGKSAKYYLGSAVTSKGRYVAIDLTSGAWVGANFGGLLAMEITTARLPATRSVPASSMFSASTSPDWTHIKRIFRRPGTAAGPAS
jgi:hypothetical protein